MSWRGPRAPLGSLQRDDPEPRRRQGDRRTLHPGEPVGQCLRSQRRHHRRGSCGHPSLPRGDPRSGRGGSRRCSRQARQPRHRRRPNDRRAGTRHRGLRCRRAHRHRPAHRRPHDGGGGRGDLLGLLPARASRQRPQRDECRCPDVNRRRGDRRQRDEGRRRLVESREHRTHAGD